MSWVAGGHDTGAEHGGGDLKRPRPYRLRMNSPAKINLFLAVLGRRADGYHDICSLICPVSLSDEMDFVLLPESGKRNGPGPRIRCGHPGVPENPDNIVWKAAEHFRMKWGHPLPPMEIRIQKQIPVAAGLGGGSGNAAVTLKALNRICGRPFTSADLKRMGADIGADVPFFIDCRPALSEGIGDRLTPVSGIPPKGLLLVAFDIAVSTARVYSSLNLALTKCQKIPNRSELNGRISDITPYLCNDLEQVTTREHPAIASARDRLRKAGAEGSLMSGSGPTVFGVFPTPDAARDAAGRMPVMDGERLIITRLAV